MIRRSIVSINRTCEKPEILRIKDKQFEFRSLKESHPSRELLTYTDVVILELDGQIVNCMIHIFKTLAHELACGSTLQGIIAIYLLWRIQLTIVVFFVFYTVYRSWDISNI